MRYFICLMLVLAFIHPVFAQDTPATGTLFVTYLSATGSSQDILITVGETELQYPQYASDFYFNVPAGTSQITFTNVARRLPLHDPIDLDMKSGEIRYLVVYDNGTTLNPLLFDLKPGTEDNSPWHYINLLDAPITVTANGQPAIEALPPQTIHYYDAPMETFTEAVTIADGTVLSQGEAYGEPYYIALTIVYPQDGTPSRYTQDFITTDRLTYLRATSALEVGYDYLTYLDLVAQAGLTETFNTYSPETTLLVPTDIAMQGLPPDIRSNPRDYLLFLAYEQTPTTTVYAAQSQITSMSGQALNFQYNNEVVSVNLIPTFYYMKGILGDLILIDDGLPLPQQ